jgi:hypothetical protein
VGSGPLAICVIGDDPFGNALDQAAASQSVDGRSLVVKRLSSANGASVCAIAFVDGSHTGETLAALGRQPILTVTDSRSSSQRGIIHFAVIGGRVRFYIDNAQAQARGLTISSRLQALAIGVNQRREGSASGAADGGPPRRPSSSSPCSSSSRASGSSSRMR